MSHLRINKDDKIIEEFADFLIKRIQEGEKIDVKNEKEIIEQFKAYIKQYNF